MGELIAAIIIFLALWLVGYAMESRIIDFEQRIKKLEDYALHN
jgi:hypothetical protein